MSGPKPSTGFPRSLWLIFFGMAWLSLLGALIFFIRPFINFSRYAASYLIIFLLLHGIMVYWYGFDETHLGTFPMTIKQYHLMDFRKVPFAFNRGNGQQGALNPRETIVAALQGPIPKSANNFTFSDLGRSKQKSDFYLRPFARLFSAFQGAGAFACSL